MIPRIIYTTWVSNRPFPERYKKFVEGWKKLMPDYDIRIITLENCPHNEWVDKAIQDGKYVLAGHWARVQRLYETGGIYVDIDIEAIKRFDDLLNNEFFIGVESDEYANNAVLGSVAGHKFLKDQMDYMLKYKTTDREVENETGPRMVTNLLKSYGWNNKEGMVGDIKVYGHKYFYPYLWNERFYEDCITKDTYMVHHWASTWTDDDTVSVIIPCYNHAQWLGEAIESCLNQTRKPCEIIVVNDGSTDNTNEVAKRYPIRLLEKPNGGLSSARNYGIERCRGKYVITLDADDKLAPDFIEKALEVGDDVVSGDAQYFGDSNLLWRPPVIHPTIKELKIANCLVCVALYKWDIWKKVGGYDENMKFGYEDWDYWIRVALAGYTFTMIPQTIMYYRKHGLSMVDDAHKHHQENLNYMATKY